MNAASHRAAGRPAWVAVAAITFLAALVWRLQVEGASEGLLFAPASGAGIEPLDGAWLSELVIRLFEILSLPWPMATTLAAFSAVVIGVLVAWLYMRLIYNDWPAPEALAFAACLVGNSVVISTVTGDHRAIPVMIACAAVVAGIRRLESVGDVQAEMSFGLVLPLLFLAGPATALLIPPLALFAACFDPIARTDLRAFFAMVLVAIMPTLLVVTGMFGMLGGDEAMRAFDTIFIEALTPQPAGEAETEALLTMTAYTILPFAILTVAYWFYKDRRRQPWSAIAVVALPLYLVAGAIYYSWPITASVPTMAFLGAFTAWLMVQRLTPTFRWVAIALMFLCTLASWSAPVRDTALSAPPTPITVEPAPNA